MQVSFYFASAHIALNLFIASVLETFEESEAQNLADQEALNAAANAAAAEDPLPDSAASGTGSGPLSFSPSVVVSLEFRDS